MNITIYGWTTRKPKVLISFIFVSVNLLVRGPGDARETATNQRLGALGRRSA
jgi:hypothetical protein